MLIRKNWRTTTQHKPRCTIPRAAACVSKELCRNGLAHRLRPYALLPLCEKAYIPPDHRKGHDLGSCIVFFALHQRSVPPGQNNVQQHNQKQPVNAKKHFSLCHAVVIGDGFHVFVAVPGHGGLRERLRQLLHLLRTQLQVGIEVFVSLQDIVYRNLQLQRKSIPWKQGLLRLTFAPSRRQTCHMRFSACTRRVSPSRRMPSRSLPDT